MTLRARTAALAVAGVLTAAGPLAAQTAVAPPPRSVATEVRVHTLRNVAAADVARSVGGYLGTTGRVAALAADLAANRLIVQGSAATQTQVTALVADLDRDVAMLHVTITVAEVPREFLTESGLAGPEKTHFWALTGREAALFQTALRHYPGVKLLSRPQVQVADGQTGFVQVGQDVPRGPGQPTIPVGVTMRVTPRLCPDGKATLLRVEGGLTSLNRNTDPTAVLSLNVDTFQTATRLPVGDTAVYAVPTTGADGKPVVTLYTVTPTVVRP
jgi:type II secretory pathway component GspD/PulD (secretin)